MPTQRRQDSSWVLKTREALNKGKEGKIVPERVEETHYGQRPPGKRKKNVCSKKRKPVLQQQKVHVGSQWKVMLEGDLEVKGWRLWMPALRQTSGH